MGLLHEKRLKEERYLQRRKRRRSKTPTGLSQEVEGYDCPGVQI
jgi:hypothetical protein